MKYATCVGFVASVMGMLGMVSSASAATVHADITQYPNTTIQDGNTIHTRLVVGTNPISVTQLGFQDFGLDGLVQTHQVGIWNSVGTLLGSVTVQAGTASPLVGDWRYEPLTSPISLAAGQAFFLGGVGSADDTISWLYGADSLGNATVNSAVGGVLGGPGLLLGNNGSGDGGYFLGSFLAPDNNWWANTAANAQFNVVPEPSTVLLLTLGGTAAALLRRRRRS